MATVKFKRNDVSSNILKSSRDIVDALARETESQTKKNILRGSKTGEYYRVPNTSKVYQASAPGEAPANRTGALASSYNSQVVSNTESVVFSNLKYSIIEFGTRDIRPRPHLRPASQEVMKKKDLIINRILARRFGKK